MKGWGLLAAVALAAGVAPSARAAETRLAYQPSSGTQVFAEVQGDRILFRSLGPSTVYVHYGFDVDGNGKIDPSVDGSYSMHKDGSLCAQKWISEQENSICGQLPSAARVSQETIGQQLLRRLDLPLSEVSRNGRNLRLRLGIYDEGKTIGYAWMTFDLTTGVVASIPVPSAAVPTTATTNTARPATPTQVAPQVKGGLSERELTDRYDAGKEVANRQCKYRNLPEVRLIESPFKPRFGEFVVRALENTSMLFNNFKLETNMYGREVLRIDVRHDAHRRAKVTSAFLVVGSERFPLKPFHQWDEATPVKTYKPYVTFDEPPGKAGPALLNASTARLVLMTDQGEVSHWTFPVGNLRYLRRAMELSEWKCSSAW
ncbi:MAG: hypothetical protein A3E01_11010 [Gammaproteobacteria bacterium RIFCSPHIGHO2_12_FULL_63_22]|nr:MAG: hypothetical protein A3E01_11010 [Gammaproteobacteria bacterium RIFCSPHIGHO2_12_FULL_63_22]